jgi:hypothetical protein
VRIHTPEETVRARDLLARASTVDDSDVLVGEDDGDDALSGPCAVRLLDLIVKRDGGALDRLYLTDPRGNAVHLEGKKLCVGERTIDLSQPLEWRGFMFHESVGQLITIYQATWLRQSGAELVLVAPMSTEISSWMVGPSRRTVATFANDVLLQRALIRDLRLMQTPPESPPPRELRVAIEHLFMIPLRQALDGAPRMARVDASEALPPRLAANRAQHD